MIIWFGVTRASIDSTLYLDCNKIILDLPEREQVWTAVTSEDWISARRGRIPVPFKTAFDALFSGQSYSEPTCLGHNALMSALFHHICLCQTLRSNPSSAESSAYLIDKALSASDRWRALFDTSTDRDEKSTLKIRQNALNLFSAGQIHIHMGNLPLNDLRSIILKDAGSPREWIPFTPPAAITPRLRDHLLRFITAPIADGIQLAARTVAREVSIDACTIGCTAGMLSRA